MDNRVLEILNAELDRQNDTVELIASENFASKAVMDLCGSAFTNKYAEGYPGKRYYNGCEHMDSIEQLAIDSMLLIFILRNCFACLKGLSVCRKLVITRHYAIL